MKRNSYVHCSFDLVESFKPRVPKTRVIGKFVSEEAETPRICTADTIQHALLGIPGCADVMQNIQKFDMRIYIHVYYLTSEDIKFPTEEEVPDVKETHEVWILSEPQKIIRQDYEITDFKTRYHKDYWVLNRKLLSIDAENLMQDDFWEYATKELEAFYQKYKTNYAKNQALGLLKELEERYKIVKEKLKETEKMEKEEKIETSLPWASAQA